MDAGTFIKTRVDALRDDSGNFYEVGDGVANDFDSWSALKLILHSAAVRMYTNVHNTQNTGDIFYIDALAGSGVSTYEDDRCFIGSPLLACRHAEMPFQKMYFIEENDEYCSALEQRLDYAFSLPEFTEPVDYQIIPRDVNDAIPDVVDEIDEIGDFERRYNYYCFVDNQSLDFEWTSIEELTPKPYGDLLINLPIAHGVGRSAKPETLDSLNTFYGGGMEEYTERPVTRNELKAEYQDRLARRDRGIQESTRVQTDIGSFYYDMLYATRKTGGNNGYMDVIQYVKQFVESVHSGHVEHILDIIDGDQTGLDEHLPDEDIEDDLPDEDLGSEQKGLTEYL